MRSLLIGLAAAAAVVTTVASSAVVATSVPPPPAATTYEGPGSASPEDAVSSYMSGLASVDVDAMVSSFAVETFVDHFDFLAYLERLGVYSATFTPVVVPAETPFARALGIERRHGTVTDQILFQFLALADPELEPTEQVLLNEDVTPEVFSGSLAAAVGAVDLAEVGSFTFVPMADVAPEAAEVYESEPNQANLETIREMFGADEITDLVVRFTVSDQEYFAFFSVVRYGDAWWVDQLGGNFASLVTIPPLRSGATPVDGIEE